MASEVIENVLNEDNSILNNKQDSSNLPQELRLVYTINDDQNNSVNYQLFTSQSFTENYYF